MIHVLLDEDLDVRFRLEFGPSYHVETIRYRGWKGKKNGALLALAASEFDVLVSGDSNLRFQQNISQYGIGVVVVRPLDKSLPNLVALLPELLRAIDVVSKGQLLEVGPLASGPG